MTGVLTTSYPRHPGDLAGAFVRDRVRELVRAGETVDVIAAGDGAEPECGDDGAAVTRVGFAVAGGAALFYGAGGPETLARGGAAAWLPAARFSAGLVAAAREKVARWSRIESHWLLPCGLAACVAGGRLDHRAYAHSGDVALLERLPFGRALARALVFRGAELVFVSEDLRRRFRRLLARADGSHDIDGLDRRLRVEALAIDGELFGLPPQGERERLRRRLALPRPTVLAVGRLVPIKGHHGLVLAVGRLPAIERPTLVILGDGPERNALAQLAARLGVDLRMPGATPRAEVAAFMKAADLLVHPSRRLPDGRTEGMPMAVREALAVGLPVVATALGGVVELAAGPSELALVAPDDAVALALAVKVALHRRPRYACWEARSCKERVAARPWSAK